MNILRWLIGIVGIIGAWKGCAWYFTLRERHALRKERDGYRDPAAPRPRLSLAPSIHQLAERAHTRRAEAQRLAGTAASGPLEPAGVPQSRQSHSNRLSADSFTGVPLLTLDSDGRGLSTPRAVHANDESGYMGTQLTWEGVILKPREMLKKERA